MNVIKKLLIFFVAASFFALSPVHAQEQESVQMAQFAPDEYFHAKVTRILTKDDPQAERMSQIVQQVRLRIVSGKEKGLEVTAQNAVLSNKSEGFTLKVGDHIVGMKSYTPDGVTYSITDHFRLFGLFGIFLFFFILISIFGRLRGVMSLGGLIVSIAIIAGFIVPQILQGRDPLLISLLGSFAILCISLYLAHGFHKQTTVALVSTFITLGISAFLAVFFVHIARFFGTGTEEALFLQLGKEAINLRGLLLGGIIIGTLGVLDDITTVQTATIKELKIANKNFSFRELYQRGNTIGREHIASLVNTLALAYTGASLPLLLLFSLQSDQPFWMILNNEALSEEIVRTLVGSVAIILAVPISTFFAAYYYGKIRSRKLV